VAADTLGRYQSNRRNLATTLGFAERVFDFEVKKKQESVAICLICLEWQATESARSEV